MIGALACLSRKDVYYLICGQGALRGDLQKYAQRAGTAVRVRMPGYQENMTWIYRNADLFVFPSKREGMPAALMEAMASGLACVVSDIRGNRELIGRSRCGKTCGCSCAEKRNDAYRKQGGMRYPLKENRRHASVIKAGCPEPCSAELVQGLEDFWLAKSCGWTAAGRTVRKCCLII